MAMASSRVRPPTDNPYANSPASPSGRVITKEAFFRARTPPVGQTSRQGGQAPPSHNGPASPAASTKGLSLFTSRAMQEEEFEDGENEQGLRIPPLPDAHDDHRGSDVDRRTIATTGHGDDTSSESHDTFQSQGLGQDRTNPGLSRNRTDRSRAESHQSDMASTDDEHYGRPSTAAHGGLLRHTTAGSSRPANNMLSRNDTSNNGSREQHSQQSPQTHLQRKDTHLSRKDTVVRDGQASSATHTSTRIIPPQQPPHIRKESYQTENPSLNPSRYSDLRTYRSPGLPSLHGTASSGTQSDEDVMLMALLAGQAAVDCHNMPVGGWEEVEEWKKELQMLSSRLSSQVSRHQREQKILTAAKTLAKLNNNNKRMSKQTMESLETAELKAAEAEKEMLVVRDREAGLRRTLMEHWAGVMAWEVRRLEQLARMSTERAEQAIEDLKQLDKLDGAYQRIDEQDEELTKRGARVEELEAMIGALSAREFEMEKEMRNVEEERKRWAAERKALREEADSRNASSGEWDAAKGVIAQALGQPKVDDVSAVVDGIKRLTATAKRKEEELSVMKEEMREVGMGLEEELRRVAADRDQAKRTVDELLRGRQEADSTIGKQVAERDITINRHANKISGLEQEVQRVTNALQVAERTAASRAIDTPATTELQAKLRQVQADLEAQDVIMGELWTILPTPAQRKSTGLLDGHSGRLKDAVASPSTDLDFEVLRKLYDAPAGNAREAYGGPRETIERVKMMIDDSKVMVERVIRFGKEREMLKSNATRAQKLVEHSQGSLETYQKQVDMLEMRLKTAGQGEAAMLEQLNDLRTSLSTLTATKRTLETHAATQAETLARLTEANADLSSKTLNLAQDAEQGKSEVREKLEKELREVKKELRGVEEEMDEMRSREQGQRIQLLDELNSLQSEVTKLRAQLRRAQGDA